MRALTKSGDPDVMAREISMAAGRSTMIRFVLPLFFCLLPILAAGVVVYSIPEAALSFFTKNISKMDALILGLGMLLFIPQMLLCWRALRWQTTGFDERADRWITHLAQAA